MRITESLIEYINPPVWHKMSAVMMLGRILPCGSLLLCLPLCFGAAGHGLGGALAGAWWGLAGAGVQSNAAMPPAVLAVAVSSKDGC